MVDLEKLQSIARKSIDQYFRSGLGSLKWEDRVFFLAWCYSGGLDNGGHAAFFHNSQADNYVETIEALEVLGLKVFSELLEAAAKVLFNGAVPRDVSTRNELIDELQDAALIDDEIESIDQKFFANGGGTRVLEALEEWYFRCQTI